MQLTIVGCSDAFGSGGRHHSCYLLGTSKGRLMIECGANSPLALKRSKIPLSSVDAIMISHCHGDHMGGLPFLYLDMLFLEPISKPLTIFGPAGIKQRIREMWESLYPGMLAQFESLDLDYTEFTPGNPREWRGLTFNAFEVDHFSGSPSLALNIHDGEKRFAFSGDSGWCDGVVRAGRGADLYLIECTSYSSKFAMHLDYLTLAQKFGEIGASHYVLTHMSDEMLEARDKIDTARCTPADDGLVISI